MRKEEKEKKKTWKKNGKEREKERKIKYFSNALRGKRVLRPTHFPFRCTYPRTPSPRALHPYTDDDPPLRVLSPLRASHVNFLSSVTPLVHPSLTYERRCLPLEIVVTKRFTVHIALTWLLSRSLLASPALLFSRCKKKKEKKKAAETGNFRVSDASMIFRGKGARAFSRRAVFFLKESQKSNSEI